MLYTLESPAHLCGALALRLGPRAALVRWRGSAVPLRKRPLSRGLYARHTRKVLVPCERLRDDAARAGFATRNWEVVDGCVDLQRFMATKGL